MGVSDYSGAYPSEHVRAKIKLEVMRVVVQVRPHELSSQSNQSYYLRVAQEFVKFYLANRRVRFKVRENVS